MVLRGKDNIPHPGISGGGSPFLRVEPDGIEAQLQRLILLLVFDIIRVGAAAPILIFGADGP